MLFLAETSPLTTPMASGAGFNVWQSLGGLVLVFGLLILCLKLLGKFNRNRSVGTTSVLAVWQLGPKREIQVLRLGDEVHYIYRHEGAMVLLKKETHQQWLTSQENQPAAEPTSNVANLFSGLKLPFLAKSPQRRPIMPARVGDLLP